MRLPWPFGRAQRSASGSGDAPQDGDSAPPPTGSPPARGSGDAWRSLPPLAETVGPPPLIAPSRPFAASLAAAEPPAPILAPLSHGRSLEAPRGLVSGIARPTTPVAGPALPAPVQRSPLRHRASGAATDAGWEEAGASEAAPEAGAPATVTAAEPPRPPLRRLAAVPSASAPVRALTRAPEPMRTQLVGLVGQPHATGSARTSPAMPAATAIQRAPAAAEPAPPATSAPSGSATPAAMPPAPRLTIGQARRLGLGAPVAGGPITGAMQAFKGGPEPSPATSSGRSAASAPPTTPGGVQRAPAVESPEMPVVGRPQPSSELGKVGLEDHGAAMTPTLPVPGPGPAAIARPIATATDRPAAGAGSPITSAQPLRPRVQRAPLVLPQRAPDQAEVESSGPVPATAVAPGTSSGGVKIHRDGDAGRLSAALDARSFTHGGEIYLPSSHGPLTSGTGKALLAHELTHVVQQRRLGSGLPAEHTSHGQSLEAEAVAAERAPDMHLARQPGPAKAPAGSPPGVFETAPSASESAPRPPGPQRAPAKGRGATKKARDASASAGASGRTHTEQELEVLAHQLYQRIGRHLRRELLVDRERVGFALDLP